MSDLIDIKGFDEKALRKLYASWKGSCYTLDDVRRAVCELNASIVHVPRRNYHTLVNEIQCNTLSLLQSKGMAYTINAFIESLELAYKCRTLEPLVKGCIPVIANEIKREELKTIKDFDVKVLERLCTAFKESDKLLSKEVIKLICELDNTITNRSQEKKYVLDYISNQGYEMAIYKFMGEINEHYYYGRLETIVKDYVPAISAAIRKEKKENYIYGGAVFGILSIDIILKLANVVTSSWLIVLAPIIVVLCVVIFVPADNVATKIIRKWRKHD